MARSWLVSVALSVLLLAAARGHAQSPADAPLAKAIDELVRKRGIGADGPGVAILVHQPNRIDFTKGYGLANLRDRTAITPQTMFELASLTKPITATAILILHDRGKLSIDDDVRKYVPELPVYREGRVIRVRELLDHTSGLPDYMAFEDVPARNTTYWVNEDYAGQFADRLAKFPLRFPTGQRYEYSNTNYMLLGLVIARASKKSFGAFLREEIFAPAGMKHSFVYEGPDAVPARPTAGWVRAVGYEKGTRKMPWNEGWGAPPDREEKLLTVGDGGVWSNLEDLARWDSALRNGKLLRPATAKLALTPSKTSDGKTNNYGLGWAVFPDGDGGLNGYGHDGSWGGFRTSYYRYLKADRTTVILSNRSDFDPDKFWYDLNDAVEANLPKKRQP
jgi:CubicO group peptidase (beta-lactamase class C family)